MAQISLLGYVLFSAVFLQFSTNYGHSKPTKETEDVDTDGRHTISITDTLLITYPNVQQRDTTLQQILVMWSNALDKYQIKDLKSKIVSEKPNSGKRVELTYTITGFSAMAINIEAVRTSVHQTIMDAHVAGVELLSTSSKSADQNMPQVPSDKKQSFSLTDTVTLAYSTTEQRTTLLEQIKDIWTTTLTTYTVTNVVVTFVSQKAIAGTTGQFQVTYQITGDSVTTINQEDVTTKFHQAFDATHVKESPDSNGDQAVLIMDTLIITYTNIPQRTVILQQILAMWRNALNPFQARNIAVNFVSETPNSGKSTTPVSGKRMEVTYTITGFSATTVDVESVRTSVHQTIIAAHVTGVELLGDDSSQQSSEVTGTTQLFRFTDTVTLTYSSINQQTVFLEQIKNIWVTTLSAFSVRNLAVTVVNAKPTSGLQPVPGSTSQWDVTYQIVGESSQTIDEDDVKPKFHQALEDAHLTGIQTSHMTSLSGQQTLTIEDTIIITYSSVQQRTTILNQILVMWRNALDAYQAHDLQVNFVSETPNSGLSTTPVSGKRMAVTYTITGSCATVVDVESVRTRVHQNIIDAHVTGVELFSANSGQQSNEGTGESQPFSFTDVVTLSYSSAAPEFKQREIFLGQMKVIWMTTLSTYTITNLAVTFVSEVKASSGALGQWDVTYKITGESLTPIDENDVKAKFHQALDAAQQTGSQTNPSAGSRGRQMLSITDTLIITYSGAEQRNTILHQVFLMWKNALDAFQAQDVAVNFVSEIPSPGKRRPPVSSKRMAVTYTINFYSTRTVDTKAVTTSAHQGIINAHVANVELLESDNSGQSTSQVSGQPQPFKLLDTVTLTYSSSQQRTNFLEQIKNIWTTSLSTFSVQNLVVTFVSEKLTSGLQPVPGSTSQWDVTYQIVGESSQTIDEDDVKPKFHQALEAAHLTGIQTSHMTSLSGQQTLTIEDTIIITYSSVQQRTVILNQILVMWRNVLDAYQAHDLKINFISETPNSGLSTTPVSGRRMAVTYTITGSCATAVDVESVRTRAHQTIMDAHVTGVELLTESTENTTQETNDNRGETPSSSDAALPFSFKDTIYLTFTSTDQRSVLLNKLQTLWETVFENYNAMDITLTFVNDLVVSGIHRHQVTYTISGESMRTVPETEVKTQFQTALKQAPIPDVEIVPGTPVSHKTGNGEGEPSTSQLETTVSTKSLARPEIGQRIALVISENVFLTYSTQSERERFLVQIFALWQTVLASYQPTNLQIVFLREEPQIMSNTPMRHQVFYQITGQTETKVVMQEIKASFRQAFHSSGMAEISTTAGTTMTPEEQESTTNAEVTTEAPQAPEEKETEVAVTPTQPLPVSTTQSTTGPSEETSEENQESVATTTMPTTTSVALSELKTEDNENQSSDANVVATTPAPSANLVIPEQTAAPEQETTTEESETQPTEVGQPVQITDSIILGFATQTDLNRNLAWLKRVWAFLIGVDLDSLQISLTQNTPVLSSFLPNGYTGHNITYSLSILKKIKINVPSYLLRFHELLHASTENYLVVFPSGQVPQSVNITIIQQILGPQPNANVPMKHQKTFLIYDSLTFSYTSMGERDSTLEKIRRTWEQTLGRDTTVELNVRQDIPTSEGPHRIWYLLTILSQRSTWDVRQLTTKFRQVLANSNVPTLVAPNATVPLGEPPQNFVTFAFYDSVQLTYTTSNHLERALQLLRQSWKEVLGDAASNIQISIYQDSPLSTPDAHLISYTILFSSQSDTRWSFVELKQSFTKKLPQIHGPGFSASVAPTGPVAEGRSDAEDLNSVQDFPGKSFVRKVFGKIASTVKTGSDQFVTYLFPDGIKLTFENDKQRDDAIEAIRFIWQRIIGKAAEVQIIIDSDFQASNNQHSIQYYVQVITEEKNLNLDNYREEFWNEIHSSQNFVLQKAGRLMVLPFIMENGHTVEKSQISQVQAAVYGLWRHAGESSENYEHRIKFPLDSEVVQTTAEGTATTTSSDEEDQTDYTQTTSGKTHNKVVSQKAMITTTSTASTTATSEEDGSESPESATQAPTPEPAPIIKTAKLESATASAVGEEGDEDFSVVEIHDEGTEEPGLNANRMESELQQQKVTIRGSFGLKFHSSTEKEQVIQTLKQALRPKVGSLGLEKVTLALKVLEGSSEFAQLGTDIHDVNFILTGLVKHGKTFDEKKIRTILISILVNIQFPALTTSSLTPENLQVSTSTSKTKLSTSSNLQANSESQSFTLVEPVNTYVIHDSFRLTTSTNNNVNSYFSQLDSAWRSVLGNEPKFTRLIVLDRPLEGKNFQTHDVWYLVVILSNNAALDLQSIKTSFLQSKPSAEVKLVDTVPDISENVYNVVTLRNTIPFNGDDAVTFVKNIGVLWNRTIGSDAILVQSWLYGDNVIDNTKDSTDVAPGEVHQLSYVIVVVSKIKSWTVDYLQTLFQQFVVKQSVATLNCACPT